MKIIILLIAAILLLPGNSALAAGCDHSNHYVVSDDGQTYCHRNIRIQVRTDWEGARRVKKTDIGELCFPKETIFNSPLRTPEYKARLDAFIAAGGDINHFKYQSR